MFLLKCLKVPVLQPLPQSRCLRGTNTAEIFTTETLSDCVVILSQTKTRPCRYLSKNVFQSP